MSSIIPIKCEPQNIFLNEYIKQEYNDESTENDYGTDGKSVYNWSMQDFKYTTENVEIQNIKIEAEIIDDEVCKRENHNVSSNNMCHVSTAYDIKNEPITCNLGIKAPSTINLIPPKHKVISCKKKQYSSQNKLSVNKPYRCKICEKSFSLKGSLKTHIWIHMQEKPYKCFICNKSFSQASTLITHKIIHNFDKPFNCDICKKSYAQKVNLKMHMMSHLSEKLCISNKTFSQKKCTTENIKKQNIKIEAEIIDDEVCKRENHYVSSNNMCHVSTAYDIKNEPITCNLGIKTPSTINLIPPKHKVISCKKKQYSSQNKLSVNKPYRCKICEKSFSLKGNLKTHSWIHMQEKPHKCYICEKWYAQKVNLKMHMKSHLSEKLSISNKTFSQKKCTTENIKKQNIKIEAEIIDDEVCKRENHNVSSNNMCHVSTAYDIKNEPVTCNLGIKAPSTINLIPPKHKVISCKKKTIFFSKQTIS